MRRLINADNLLDNIKLIQHPELLTIDDWIDVVGQESTVEAVPVVHAHWEFRDSAFAYEGEFGGYVCSNCNRAFLDDLCQDNGSEMVNVGEEFKYCPYCGARMDEVSKVI